MSFAPRFAAMLAAAAVITLPTFAAVSATGRPSPDAAASLAEVAAPSPVATPIPEPTTLAPLAGMALVALRRRRAS